MMRIKDTETQFFTRLIITASFFAAGILFFWLGHVLWSPFRIVGLIFEGLGFLVALLFFGLF